MSTTTDQTQSQQVKPSLPTSITLGGQTYLVSESPELKDFISKVGQVEKAKVHSTIQELKNGIEELRRVNPAAPVSPATELATFKTELLNEVRETIMTIVEPINARLNQQQAETIEQYRERLIEANANTCIPEMVQGKTKEELLASLNESIKVRAKYSPNADNQPGGTPKPNVPEAVQNAAEQAQNSAMTPKPVIPEGAPQTAQPAPVAQPATPAPAQAPQVLQPGAIAPIVEIPLDVKGMTNEEFGKKREQLEANLRNLMGGQQG